jgi:hypothetical protein
MHETSCSQISYGPIILTGAVTSYTCVLVSQPLPYAGRMETEVTFGEGGGIQDKRKPQLLLLRTFAHGEEGWYGFRSLKTYN